MKLKKFYAVLVAVTLILISGRLSFAVAGYQFRTGFEEYNVGEFTAQMDSSWTAATYYGAHGVDIIRNDNGNHLLKMSVNQTQGGMLGIYKQNLALTEDFVLKQRIQVSDATRRIVFRLFDSLLDGMQTITFSAGTITAVNGGATESIQSYRINTDYDVKIVVDVSESTYDVYVNGYLKGEDFSLSREISGAIKNVNLCESAYYTLNTTLLDNVEIYTLDGYVPDTDASTFYVSERGNDLAKGTISEPFATVEAAKQKIMELLEAGLQRDYNIIIREGTYRGLSFKEEDSPADGYTITYQGYPGERVRLTNANKVTGWSEYQANIYRAKLPAYSGIKTLYIGEQRGVLARHPNSGYNSALKMPQVSANSFRFQTGDVLTLGSTAGVETVIWPGGPDGYWDWICEIKNVGTIDYSSNSITLTSNCSYVLGTGTRYYLQNSLAFLDTENEFYFDESSGFLYYYTSADVNTLDIYADTNQPTVLMSNASSITFKNLEISKTNRYMDGVNISDSRFIEMQDCIIRQTGRNGVFIKGASTNITIQDCEINDIGRTAIQMEGSAPAYGNKNHHISGNHIYDTGKIEEHGTAIQLSQTGDSLITKNIIHDTPRYGISLKGVSYGAIAGREINGVTVTEDNYRDFVFTKNNIISYNDISKVNQNSQDNGMIELYGAVDNVICDNYLHDSSIPFSVGYAIYLDGSTNNTLVTRNLLCNLQQDGLPGELEYVIFSKGIGNRIHNNLLANNNAGAAIGSSRHLANEAHRDLEITNNIIFNSGDDLLSFTNWSDDRIAVCDKNVYYQDSGVYSIGGYGAPASTLSQWKTLLNNKFDQNSVIADPLFANESQKDYRLHPNSPAFALGFVPLDIPDESTQEDDLYEISDSQFEVNRKNNGNMTMDVRFGVVKKLEGSSVTDILIKILDLQGNEHYKYGIKRKLTSNTPFFVRIGMSLSGINEDYRLEIYADETYLYGAYMADLE